ncbi:hypothetical protein ElyMa_002483000 [Elysia marginata]|uniref:BZIP domain-containing protein n=1 Tax=Elysia marginata TaxID=1093978 RepID=A0AAV4GQ28_9GAST|nr:hypothetical protein ElyMa_002483000 [Elysia marginata]
MNKIYRPKQRQKNSYNTGETELVSGDRQSKVRAEREKRKADQGRKRKRGEHRQHRAIRLLHFLHKERNSPPSGHSSVRRKHCDLLKQEKPAATSL